MKTTRQSLYALVVISICSTGVLAGEPSARELFLRAEERFGEGEFDRALKL